MLMAKTTYSLIPAGFDFSFSKALSSGDRFTYARYRRQIGFFSRKRRAGMTQKSLLPQIALDWAALTPTEQDAWATAGAEMGLNGWRLFVQDSCKRIINEIETATTPVTTHQVMAGLLDIDSPATGIKITQLHPLDYWVSRKVTGSKNMYEPVKVTESFGLPLELEISYKSDLTSLGAGSSAAYYALVYSHYQGRTIENVCRVELDLSSDWEVLTASISSVVGLVRGYALFLEVVNCTGSLWVDNIKATHSGQNWVRDTYCKDIDQGFTRAFFQVPKHWVGVDIPVGASFGSVYVQ
jgi:hypothetical protein